MPLSIHNARANTSYGFIQTSIISRLRQTKLGITCKLLIMHGGLFSLAFDCGQHGLDCGRLDAELWKAGAIGGRNIVVLHQCDLIAR